MGDDEELGRVEEILPDDVRSSTEGSEGIEVGLRHPNAEGGVLLSESLAGSNRRDALHSLRCSSRVDKYVLVVGALRGGRQVIADEFAQTKLKAAGDK